VERATRARERGACRRAVELLTAGLNQAQDEPSEARLRLERARCHTKLADWPRVERDSRRALALGEDDAALVLAKSLLEQQRAGEAVAVLEERSRRAPDDASFWTLYATALSRDTRHDDAVAAMDRARAADPGLAAEASDLLIAAGRHHDNIALTRRELERPGAMNRARLVANLGSSLSALGHSSEAVDAFREALRLEPELAGAHWALGICLLRLGHFEEGFRCNEHRQKSAGDCHRLGVRPWRGERLEDKHLVVTIEQGFGDTVQFVRFLPLARRLAARTTLIATPRMERVLKSNPALGDIKSTHPGFGFGDFQTLVMSLPHHLGATSDLERALGPVPYLYPEPALVESWRARLPQGRKIALVWQGNPSYAGDRWRSMPFRNYEPLLARFAGRATFVSLQKHFARDALQASPARDAVLDLGEVIDAGPDAFIDSLAILSLVDLFITTDTGLAHLAGAAGVPTWLLLGAVADWRWGTESDRVLWYPTMRLFRQASTDDWRGVIDGVSDALASVI
jgi:Flp pilus assembly protein TadD